VSIDPYGVADCLARTLEDSSAAVPGFTLPAQTAGRAIERRMGAGVFACAGTGVSITNVSAGAVRPNCEPDPRYTVEVTIARDCAVEFNDDGVSINPRVDATAREISADSGVLWSAFGSFNPSISWQITGGLALTTASFGLDGTFGLNCAPTAPTVPTP
jgi:hypothetical protein